MLKKLFPLIIILSFAAVAGAAEYRAGESITIRDNDSLTTDLFAALLKGTSMWVASR